MYIQKLDTSGPGLFVVKLNKPLDPHNLELVQDTIMPKINEFAPESKLIVLSSDFDSIGVPDDAVMRELGWERVSDGSQAP